MLGHSRRPLRDGLDVVRAAAAAHLSLVLPEVPMSVSSLLRLSAALLAGLGLFALGFAVNDLAHGLREVPRHWWSTVPLVMLAAAAVLWALSLTQAITRVGRRRTPAP